MTDAAVFAVIKAHHRDLLDILRVLDSSPGTRPSAAVLRAAIWPALQDYGLRDVHGSVWEPGTPLPLPAVVPVLAFLLPPPDDAPREDDDAPATLGGSGHPYS